MSVLAPFFLANTMLKAIEKLFKSLSINYLKEGELQWQNRK